jgi:hypothetical protein
LNFIEVNKHPNRGGSLHSERHGVVEEHCTVLYIFRLLSLPHACRFCYYTFPNPKKNEHISRCSFQPLSMPCHCNCCETHCARDISVFLQTIVTILPLKELAVFGKNAQITSSINLNVNNEDPFISKKLSCLITL